MNQPLQEPELLGRIDQLAAPELVRRSAVKLALGSDHALQAPQFKGGCDPRAAARFDQESASRLLVIATSLGPTAFGAFASGAAVVWARIE